MEELAKPQWYIDRKGEVPPGKLEYYQLPIFNYHAGFLSSPYTATYYELAQRHPQVHFCQSPMPVHYMLEVCPSMSYRIGKSSPGVACPS